MINRDLCPSDVRMTFDDFYTLYDRLASNYFEGARLQKPGLKTPIYQRMALQRLSATHPRVFQSLIAQRHLHRRTPNRISPFEQIKARTGVLDPMGEITGGNFTSAI